MHITVVPLRVAIRRKIGLDWTGLNRTELATDPTNK